MTPYDLTRLKCPLPIVELFKIAKQLAPDVEIVAVADDPAFWADVEAWCAMTGHQLISRERDGARIQATIKLGSGVAAGPM